MEAEKKEAIVVELRESFQRFVTSRKQRIATDIEDVNLAIGIGRQIELFSGHEKLLPQEFQELTPALCDASLEVAKQFLALSKRYSAQDYPTGITDYKLAREELARIEVQLELLPKGQRGVAAVAPPTEPVKELIASITKLKTRTLELVKDADPKQWDVFLKRQFLTEVAPILAVARDVESTLRK